MAYSPTRATEHSYAGESRRTHKKSRFGCKLCKERRVKCDERRPACGNCVKYRRQCPYLTQKVVLPASASTPAPASTSTATAPSSSSPDASPAEFARAEVSLPSPNCESLLYSTSESYSLCHLELLIHFQSLMGDMFYDSEALASKYSSLIAKLGFTSPYLMDEILGLAAAHKSTTVQEASSREFYREEATRLQTRALSQFNAIPSGSEKQHSLSAFLFSTLLGQHVLFDTFSSQSDFSTVLDRFVHCLGLHRGIRTIVAESYSSIIAQIEELDGPDSAMAQAMGGRSEPGSQNRGDECAALRELLQISDLSQTEAEAYSRAVDSLQHVFDAQRGCSESSHQRFGVVQGWPVRVPAEYVHLLTQRKPEALIILAYYGMLLHGVRYSWSVAGAGRFLIEGITAYLGSYWAEWLDAPNRMLEMPDPVNR